MQDHFAAIADPTRREILAMVAKRDCTVNEIADHFDVTRTAISKHLRLLRETGFIAEQKRGRERLQCFNGEALAPISDWVRTYEDFWERKLARLKALVEEEK
ncbi:MAG: winged helix-turn-helix transcriptional regulator [Pseudomonadales bacterium]|nr:winged helix-turn-helix transcriptional regulator [Pseudomonadales bacterium]